MSQWYEESVSVNLRNVSFVFICCFIFQEKYITLKRFSKFLTLSVTQLNDGMMEVFQKHIFCLTVFHNCSFNLQHKIFRIFGSIWKFQLKNPLPLYAGIFLSS